VSRLCPVCARLMLPLSGLRDSSPAALRCAPPGSLSAVLDCARAWCGSRHAGAKGKIIDASASLSLTSGSRARKPAFDPEHAAMKAFRFKPGQSGNPGGLPKAYHEARQLARAAAPAMMSRLIELALTSQESGWRASA
jgi:hypothetical protein